MAAPPTVPAAQGSAAPPTTWTVAPGESFWRIAESVVSSALARPPTDADIAPYWSRLIAANRDRLPDRDNPNLLYVGQTLVVPPP